MKCEEFKTMVYDVLDTAGPTPEMSAHMESCSDCRNYYDETVLVMESATPSEMPAMPSSLSDNVAAKVAAERRRRMWSRARRITAGVAAAVLVAVSIFVAGRPDNAVAAGRIFSDALPAAGEVRTLVATVKIRTAAHENFSAIDLRGKMVPHKVTVILDANPVWRVEKSRRTAMSDGTRQYMWIEGSKVGYVSGTDAELVEWRYIFLNPSELMEMEKAMADKGGASYKISETDKEIHLTVKAKAKGDFTNSYMLNTSIEESDNRREYVFDKSTNLPKSIKIYVSSGVRSVLVAEMTDIEYDVPVDETVIASKPSGLEWRNLDEPVAGDSFVGITAEEAARKILDGMAEDRFDEIAPALIYFDTSKIRNTYAGIKVDEIGKSFKSGLYPGVFVPYKIIMPNGKTEKFNMALRNDNPNKVWLLDGGI